MRARLGSRGSTGAQPRPEDEAESGLGEGRLGGEPLPDGGGGGLDARSEVRTAGPSAALDSLQELALLGVVFLGRDQAAIAERREALEVAVASSADAPGVLIDAGAGAAEGSAGLAAWAPGAEPRGARP